MNDAPHPVARLVDLMARLRAPDGCPWDREQDHRSLAPYLIEEAYELLDAIEDGDDAELRDELGDVLLQVVFHCQVAAEDGRFDLADVARTIGDKLVRRHPHVFADSQVADAAGVVRQWDAIKRGEQTAATRASILDGVPRHLPALSQAEKLQRKAAKVGFDWPDVHGVTDKIREEIDELEAEAVAGDTAACREEMGDLLFALVNLCRHLDCDPEAALRDANRKFTRRFQDVEARVAASGRDFTAHDLDELDAYWNAAKDAEAAAGD